MKQVLTIVLILMFGAGLGWLLLSGEPDGPPQRHDAQELTVAPAEEMPLEALADEDAEPAAILAARQRIADAELALQTAIEQRRAAQADIDKAELEVEELERWVAEIEARGEDPVDYADEGLEKLQPAFFAYQDAFERLELAEAMEIAATEELALANAALSAELASAANGD